MLSLWNILVLAVLQGLTEFIPVSSSGHLVLGQAWLDLALPGLTLEIVLHAGTLISVLIYYRRKIAGLTVEFLSGRGEGRRYAVWLVLASLPAALLYVAAGSRVESLFSRPDRVGLLLMANGLLLFSVYWSRRSDRPLRWHAALAMGIAQACALLPGISRSGATISMARRLGIEPRRAAEFSLLMSVPAVAGAMLFDMIALAREGGGLPARVWPLLALGAIVAAGVGWLAIAALVRVLSSGRFWLFGIYCLAIGALAWRWL